VLEVRARPNARGARIDGLHDGALAVAVNAPAVDDRANRALLAFLAGEFGVARGRARLERGARRRAKRVRLVEPRRVPAWFDELGGRRAQG
jgi:uncharacterized protein (TIGR00251 family)